MIKVAELSQDMRFDVPVIGVGTVRVSAEVKLRAIAVESGKTLLLERNKVVVLAGVAVIFIVERKPFDVMCLRIR